MVGLVGVSILTGAGGDPAAIGMVIAMDIIVVTTMDIDTVPGPVTGLATELVNEMHRVMLTATEVRGSSIRLMLKEAQRQATLTTKHGLPASRIMSMQIKRGTYTSGIIMAVGRENPIKRHLKVAITGPKLRIKVQV